MACGCQTTCGCTIIGDGATAQVVESPAGTFTVSAIPFISSVADSDCLDLGVDEAGELEIDLILDDSESISLTCSPTGLVAELILDPASTAPIAVTADGLRVDCCDGPETVGAVEPGTIIDYAGVQVPTGYLECWGQEVQQSLYPDLYDALTLYGAAASTVSGTAVITDLDTTSYIQPGMTVVANGFSTATTVLTVDSGTQITVTDNATFTVNSASEVHVFVWGYPLADPANFIVPDARDAVTAGLGDMGGSDRGLIAAPEALQLGGFTGLEAAILVASNLPLHSHGAGTLAVSTAISGSSSVTTSSDGAHDHNPGSGGGGEERGFVTVQSSGTYPAGISTALIDVAGADIISIPYGEDAGAGVIQQTNNRATTTDGSHDHTVDGAAMAAILALNSGAVSGNTADAGSGTPDGVSVIQPTLFVRKIIKT